MGFPVIADTDIPEIHPSGITKYEALVKELDYKKIVPRSVEVRGFKVKVSKIPVPVLYGPAFEGERVRKENLYVEFGGKKATGFEFLKFIDMDKVEDGKVELIGPDIDNIKEKTQKSQISGLDDILSLIKEEVFALLTSDELAYQEEKERKPRIILVVGVNGTGKTTLIRGILGILKPMKGKIIWNRQAYMSNKGHVGYVPQKERLDPVYPLTILEVVQMGTFAERPWSPRLRPSQKKSALEALELVGMSHLSRMLLHERRVT